MFNKKIGKGKMLIVSAVLAFACLALPKAYAEVALDTTDCSIEINVQGSDFRELAQLAVDVNIYKVADINKAGLYTAAEGFSALDFSKIDETTKAEDWLDMALLAEETIAKDSIEKTTSASIAGGSVTIPNLKPGMYLIDAQPVQSASYQYEFTPYLVSVPHYYVTAEGGYTDWIYHRTGEYAVGLKPAKTDLYGDLVINKTLDVYNETNGGATFVFQIEATKTDVDTGETKKVYSDVVSMTFDKPGKDSITIENIPAGADVVVTEIYSGASYELTTDASKTVKVVADDLTGAPVNVDFSNTYDGRLNGGSGIVNHFSYNSENGEWTHEATEDSTP